MTDNAPTTDDQPHPFDPDVPKRIGAYLDILAEVVPDHDLIACLYDSSDAEYPLTASDLRGLLERDAYAEKTRLQLAEKCATYRSQLDEARTILQRVTAQMEEYDKHSGSRVNVRQVLNLLSPTWPDGNYQSAPAPADAELQAAPIPFGLAGSPAPITVNNPEGWEDSWDRAYAADEAAALHREAEDRASRSSGEEG